MFYWSFKKIKKKIAVFLLTILIVYGSWLETCEKMLSKWLNGYSVFLFKKFFFALRLSAKECKKDSFSGVLGGEKETY